MMKGKILFLGYDANQTTLIDFIKRKGFQVDSFQGKVDWSNAYRLAISYGYKHVITANQIRNSSCPIINLHISYLPWNRGAHPNFWSHVDRTPSGVSIHMIDEGVDTGAIIYQKRIDFEECDDTFEKTYKILLCEMELLFKENFDQLISHRYKFQPQASGGTYHKRSDLPIEFGGWSTNIKDEIKRLTMLRYLKSYR